MDKKIIVSAGHDLNGDPGAIAFNNKTEAEYTHELRELVVKHLYNRMTLMGLTYSMAMASGTVMEDNDNDKLWATINQYNKLKSTDVGCDIHFNYNAPNATGVEVFISPNTAGANKNRALFLVRKISNILGIPVRQGYDEVFINGKKKYIYRDYKIPSESAPKTLGIIERTRPQVMLIEVCFLNQSDLPKYEACKEEVADAIAEALLM